MNEELRAESEKEYRKEKNRFFILRTEIDNLTVKKLAEKLGISEGTISALENGKNKARGFSALTAYKKYFGVSYEYLLGECEAREPKNQVVSKELGLDDDAIKTLRMILAQDENLVKFMNAFLGGGAESVKFLSSFYEYLNNASQDIRNGSIDLEFFKDINGYFHDIMYSKLKTDIDKRNKDYNENFMNDYDKNMYESLPEDVFGFYHAIPFDSK